MTKTIIMRMVCAITALTLTLALMCVEVRPASAETEIQRILKVGLYYGSSAKTVATVTSERGFYAGTFNDREFSEEQIIENTTVMVRRGDGGIVIQDTDGNTLYTEHDGAGVGLSPVYTDFWE